MDLSESFWGPGGGGLRAGLWGPEHPPPSAGPGRSGFQDADWPLPSLGAGRLGGPACSLRRSGRPGASHDGSQPPPVAGAGPAGLPFGRPGRDRGTPDGCKAEPGTGEEGAPPTQSSDFSSQGTMNHVWSPNPWSGPTAPRGSCDDKLSQPQLIGCVGQEAWVHVSSHMCHQKITAALINIIYDLQR